jgi:hypothetical protein
MAKWYGEIGFGETVETAPGVHEEQITKRNYYGDLNRNTRRLQSTEHLNDDINISNEISILADPYAMDHFHSIRYAEFSGATWKVTNVEVVFPRLVLTLGGVWNE